MEQSDWSATNMALNGIGRWPDYFSPLRAKNSWARDYLGMTISSYPQYMLPVFPHTLLAPTTLALPESNPLKILEPLQCFLYPPSNFPLRIQNPYAKFRSEFDILMQISLENLASPCKYSVAFKSYTRITSLMAPLCKNTITYHIYYSSVVCLLLEIALDSHTWGGTSANIVVFKTI